LGFLALLALQRWHLNRIGALPTDRREERVTMELHLTLAQKLRSDPQAVLAVTPNNLERLRSRLSSPIGQGWVSRWAELLDGPVEDLISGMLADTPEGRDLRQNSPFAGALTQSERIVAIERAN
jgi:hypothetical protein